MHTSLARLPSLDLLRGFVAVGRRMSISMAAQDLFLTQSAVSRQIIALEDVLGCKLFTRGYRAIEFTAEGERLFRVADVVVQQLQDACGALRRTGERKPVTITASIGVTALWLLPRLGRLQQSYPNIDLRVATNNKLLDLRTEGIDLGIRYCREGSTPPGSLKLFDEFIVPVAHRKLVVGAEGLGPLVAQHVLLEFDDPRRPWLQWANWVGEDTLREYRPRGILRFNQYDQVIQAAAAGQGLALGRLALIKPLLDDGRLVPLDLPIRSADASYWLAGAYEDARSDVTDVTEWICEEAANLREQLLVFIGRYRYG
jgi:DNA-binding transcriptional LysR family regulator